MTQTTKPIRGELLAAAKVSLKAAALCSSGLDAIAGAKVSDLTHGTGEVDPFWGGKYETPLFDYQKEAPTTDSSAPMRRK